ncbi:post-transcriptional regulator [Paenibacillus tarimensis]|uniref:post-transcriptional regulator n=1 Tax=Paenibacillus tarimensis TaxID=416012 RepID=UPI001F16F809|nr:post-transcriptional regulator [Paenibacillus tarimensis]MCF2944003.1 post-transcriptional regulator [Paenibacillus tarimensis]
MSEQSLTDEELTMLVESLCESKAEEFRLIGYEHVTGREVWDCVSEKYSRTGMPALHQIVNDILSLKTTQFMNFLTLGAYKGTYF